MQVYIVGFDRTYAGVMTGLMDIFDRAKSVLAQSGRSSDAQKMRARLVSADGKPIRCQNHLLLNVHCAIQDIRRADLVIITSIHDVNTAVYRNPFMVDWIRRFHHRGTAMAGVCTGNFLLAEAGLLNGRHATTHWSMRDQFRRRYPQVGLKTRNLVINNDHLCCAASGASSSDMAYYFLEKYAGRPLAAGTAAFFSHNYGRVLSETIGKAGGKTGHNDAQILCIQHWIDRHMHEPLSIAQLSRQACMSPRTFERRFKKATGQTPSAYIQEIRVASAKRQLVSTNLTFDEISDQMGYANSGSFRKVFVRRVGLLPSAYRKRRRI